MVVTDSHPARTERVTAELRREFGDRVTGYPMDVTDRLAITDVLTTVARTHGTVDLVVNNAAVNAMGQIFDYDPEDWDRSIEVNLTGPWNLCRLAMPGMRSSGRGIILNISSVAPDMGGPVGEGVYAVTKGGLNVLTRMCALEGAPHGIRSNTLAMGVVTGTKWVDANPQVTEPVLDATPLGRHADCDDIVEAALFLCSERSRHVTGEILCVCGGFVMRP
ncbi:MAG: SDR family oxidoreductase [Ilumatobacteraceae bacterium]